MNAATDGPIILFDGVCHFCAGCVRFVIRRDQSARFRFASLQSPIAARYLDPADPTDSMALVSRGKVHRKSGAALRTAWQLDGLWPLLAIFLLVPWPLRDAVYDFIGARRYRWFGHAESCWIPDRDISDRFLDQAQASQSG